MWAHHWWNPLLPALADSPHLRRGAPLPELSSGSAVAEKGGLEGFSGAFGRNLSLLTHLMPKRNRDAEEEKGDFRPRNPRDEKCGAPRGPADHARGQALSGTLRASTIRLCGACMDPEEFSKVWLIETWRA